MYECINDKPKNFMYTYIDKKLLNCSLIFYFSTIFLLKKNFSYLNFINCSLVFELIDLTVDEDFGFLIFMIFLKRHFMMLV